MATDPEYASGTGVSFLSKLVTAKECTTCAMASRFNHPERVGLLRRSGIQNDSLHSYAVARCSKFIDF